MYNEHQGHLFIVTNISEMCVRIDISDLNQVENPAFCESGVLPRNQEEPGSWDCNSYSYNDNMDQASTVECYLTHNSNFRRV